MDPVENILYGCIMYSLIFVQSIVDRLADNRGSRSAYIFSISGILFYVKNESLFCFDNMLIMQRFVNGDYLQR